MTVLLENAGRRVAMSILDYLEDRDGYLTTEVYSEFKNKLKEGITDSQCRDMARAAIKRAAGTWQTSTDADILQALAETDVRRPSGE